MFYLEQIIEQASHEMRLEWTYSFKVNYHEYTMAICTCGQYLKKVFFMQTKDINAEQGQFLMVCQNDVIG